MDTTSGERRPTSHPIDEHVPNGATATLSRVDGGLKVGNGAKIRAATGNLVVVAGEAEFGGNASVECDLESGTLVVRRAGKLKVAGDLTVHGILDVSNSIEVTGTIRAENVDVGGHVKGGSISCQKMRVGGTAEVTRTLKAESVDVGGKIEVGEELDVKDLSVGGKAEVGGGRVTGTINAGGKFESSSRLEFGELQVFGVGSLAAKSKGKKLTASGKFEAGGDLDCDQVEIYGSASIRGNCRAVRVDVKGKLDVDGALAATETLEVSGVTDVYGEFSANRARINGRFTAEKATIASDAEISGSSQTRRGMKADTLTVSSGSRCTGPLVARTIGVGRSGPGFSAFAWGQRVRIQAGTSQVEDLYGDTVLLGEGSRAARIFARTVELGSGCDVEEVTYVDELKLADHVKVQRTVKKVDRLQEPPL